VQALEAVGTAVYGRVRGPLHPRLVATAVSVRTAGPLISEFAGAVDATVTYTLVNTGNENVTPRATVSLTRFLGSGPRARVALPEILPGATVTFSHTFDNVEPLGHLTASVTATALGVRTSGSAGTVVIPWGLVVVLVLLILLALVLFRRRRRQRAAATQPRSAP
ncbi:protein of unknown function cell surface, partial [mine drainage metagenome]